MHDWLDDLTNVTATMYLLQGRNEAHRRECQIPWEKKNVIFYSSTWCSDLHTEGCLCTLPTGLKHCSVWNTSWIPTLRENFWLWIPGPWVWGHCYPSLPLPGFPWDLPPPLPTAQDAVSIQSGPQAFGHSDTTVVPVSSPVFDPILCCFLDAS